MDALLGNLRSGTSFGNVQGIYPDTNFTCSGNIKSWILGAVWVGSTDSRFTELQIWRPGSEDGYYTKVGSSTIIIPSENTTQLYHFDLSSPLPFQAGDVLGYYQPDVSSSQLTLVFEINEQTPLSHGYFFHQEQAASQLQLSENDSEGRSGQLLINAQTGEFGIN